MIQNQKLPQFQKEMELLKKESLKHSSINENQKKKFSSEIMMFKTEHIKNTIQKKQSFCFFSFFNCLSAHDDAMNVKRKPH